MRTVLVTGALFLILLTGCGKKDAPPADSPAGQAQPPAQTAAAPRAESNAQPLRDPCTWLTPQEVSAIIGPLAGPPQRVFGYGQLESKPDGRACVYTLPPEAAKIPSDTKPTISIEVAPDGAGMEAGFRAADHQTQQLFKQLNWKETAKEAARVVDQKPPDGWDYTNGFPSEFYGRIGHVAVHIGIAGLPKVSGDAIMKLASTVRDRVPDRPFAADDPHDSEDQDPCTLLTAAEASKVLGPLSVPPYRSDQESSLAASEGGACSYYTSKHHVFTLRPEWTMGKQLFSMSARTGAFFTKAAGLPSDAEGSLVGSWDQASVGVDGNVLLLKGDRMLTVAYRTANIERADALKLAEIAVQRLGE